MAKVQCGICLRYVNDSSISASEARRMDKMNIDYECDECKVVKTIWNALEQQILDDPCLQEIPDKFFMDVLQMRGYHGQLVKNEYRFITQGKML